MSSTAAQIEFAGFPESAATDRSENALLAYVRLSAENGGLIPQAMLPEALKLSQQRVSQLVAARRFDVHRLGGLNFVTGDSLEKFLELERHCGFRYDVPSVGSMVRSVGAAIRAHRTRK